MATNQKPTGKLQVYGNYAVGSVLKSTNTLADVNGLGTLHYQWLIDGKDIDDGPGLDVVKYLGQYGFNNQHNYAIQKLSSGAWTVSYAGPVIAIYPPPSTEGIDTLTNV